MKRWVLVLIVAGVSSVAVGALELLPGVAAVWKDAETIPRAGLSLKGVALDMSGGVIAWTAFELRTFADLRNGDSQIDLSWPGVFGFVYPGVSIEIGNDGVVPWFYGEVDLFYFPFLFAAIIAFERPWFIPSVYMGPRFGPADVGWNTGIRLSIPVGLGKLIDE